MITLLPAYNRDYQSKEAVLADYNADKDFILSDMESPFDNKPINRPQVEKTYAGQKIQFRYSKNRRVVVVEVPRQPA